ncbi:MAG: nicotinate-nucleotide adenylyltransferase [Pirellulales bacterium]|nr:nicotinate-nucleotide adenylyltransferase [Pirellulales bacterium]
MRLGIFGGTFDPVHLGHLILAECCREQAQLDQVWFLPAATPPHKHDRPMTPAGQRVEMLELAIGGHPAFGVSRLEIDRGGVSYTVDSLVEIGRLHAHAELFFLMGADSLVDLPRWREPRQICSLALPLVVRRQGLPEPDLDCLNELVTPERLAQIRAHAVEMPLVGISSSDLRERVAAGRSIRFQTPRAVEVYIETQALYRPESK